MVFVLLPVADSVFFFSCSQDTTNLMLLAHQVLYVPGTYVRVSLFNIAECSAFFVFFANSGSLCLPVVGQLRVAGGVPLLSGLWARRRCVLKCFGYQPYCFWPVITYRPRPWPYATVDCLADSLVNRAFVRANTWLLGGAR